MITLNNTKKNSWNIFILNLTNESVNKKISSYTIYYYVR